MRYGHPERLCLVLAETKQSFAGLAVPNRVWDREDVTRLSLTIFLWAFAPLQEIFSYLRRRLSGSIDASLGCQSAWRRRARCSRMATFSGVPGGALVGSGGSMGQP